MTTVELDAIERWFIGRGLPHFIAGYSAGRDIWTRSLGTMVAIYLVGGVANGLHGGWSTAQNLGAAAGSLGILLALLAIVNLARGRRLLERPTSVGPAELALLVIGPASTALVFGFQWRSGLVVGGVITGLLVGVYVVTSYGLVPMTRWAAGRIVVQLSALGGLFVRALPLLLLFVTFLFINAEVWQVAGQLAGPGYPAVIGLFFAIGSTFVIGRLPIDVAEIGHFDSWTDAERTAGSTPAASLCPQEDSGPVDPQLSRRQWINVGLVLLFSQGLVITLVGIITGLFFVVFGFIAIPADTAAVWLATDEPIHHVNLLGVHVAEPLLRVAGFLAAFTALYFTVYLVTDETYRREFRTEIVGEVREAFAARAIYLAHRSA